MHPVRSGSLVLAVAADQRAVIALDEVSGRVLWRSAAPRGVTWTAVVTRSAGAAPRARSPEPLVLATGYDEHGSVLARLGTGGAVRWLRRSPALEDFDEVTVAEHGEALKLFSRRRCAAWFLDAESGERRGPPGQKLSLSGEMIERWPVHGLGGEPHLSCQNSLTLLAALDGVVVVSSFGKRAGLQVLAAGSEPRWKLPGQGFRLLHAGEGALVLYWFAAGERAVLARLRAQSGQALWREELGAACTDDPIARWPLVVRGASGEPTAVLVQDCERASLYELPSGKRRWSRPTGGGLVLIRFPLVHWLGNLSRVEQFEKAMDEQRAKARAAWAGSGEAASDAIWFDIRQKVGATDFLGYDTERAEGQIRAIVVEGKEVPQLLAGQSGWIVTNQTPFYGESGGQVGDHGTITVAGGKTVITVTDTAKKLDDMHVHLGVVTKGTVKVGDEAVFTVDGGRRESVANEQVKKVASVMAILPSWVLNE